jgi:hypothetical protein
VDNFILNAAAVRRITLAFFGSPLPPPTKQVPNDRNACISIYIFWFFSFHFVAAAVAVVAAMLSLCSHLNSKQFILPEKATKVEQQPHD